MDILLKFANENFDATPISTENKTKLENYIRSILKSLTDKNYHGILVSLLMLREFISDNIKPENLSPEFADFIMDQEMYRWVEFAVDKKNFSDYDLTALDLIGKELSELLSQNNIVTEKEVA